MDDATLHLIATGILYLIVFLLWLNARSECERADRAWDSIAELRLHLDVFYTNQQQINKIILEEIGIELAFNEVGYGAKEFHISKFNPPHPEAD